MVFLKTTIVLDTSAALDDLQFIKLLIRDARFNATEILIPRETLKELDRIKDREGVKSALGIKARETINWINSTLVAEDMEEVPVLRGQRYNEVILQDLKNDDSILDCAIYNARTTGRLTIMLSNDRNLCNRAVIEGVDTLESSAPGVTVERVYEAIRQRTMNDMDLDNWEQPHWSPPPQEDIRQQSLSPSLPAPDTLHVQQPIQPQEELEDEEMMDESAGPIPLPAPAPAPPSAPAVMPAPVQGGDMQTQIMGNLSALIDWHLRREFNDEELACLKYTHPPSTSVEMARVLKQFSTLFRELVPRTVMTDFLEAAKRRKVNKEYIMLHVKVLQALSQYSTDYQTMIAKFFPH